MGRPDVSVPSAARPTTIAPVSGGGESSSANYKGRFVITAPQPTGKTASANHQATISVTGEKQ